MTHPARQLTPFQQFLWGVPLIDSVVPDDVADVVATAAEPWRRYGLAPMLRLTTVGRAETTGGRLGYASNAGLDPLSAIGLVVRESPHTPRHERDREGRLWRPVGFAVAINLDDPGVSWMEPAARNAIYGKGVEHSLARCFYDSMSGAHQSVFDAAALRADAAAVDKLVDRGSWLQGRALRHKDQVAMDVLSSRLIAASLDAVHRGLPRPHLADAIVDRVVQVAQDASFQNELVNNAASFLGGSRFLPPREHESLMGVRRQRRPYPMAFHQLINNGGRLVDDEFSAWAACVDTLLQERLPSSTLDLHLLSPFMADLGRVLPEQLIRRHAEPSAIRVPEGYVEPIGDERARVELFRSYALGPPRPLVYLASSAMLSAPVVKAEAGFGPNSTVALDRLGRVGADLRIMAVGDIVLDSLERYRADGSYAGREETQGGMSASMKRFLTGLFEAPDDRAAGTTSTEGGAVRKKPARSKQQTGKTAEVQLVATVGYDDDGRRTTRDLTLATQGKSGVRYLQTPDFGRTSTFRAMETGSNTAQYDFDAGVANQVDNDLVTNAVRDFNPDVLLLSHGTSSTVRNGRAVSFVEFNTAPAEIALVNALDSLSVMNARGFIDMSKLPDAVEFDGSQIPRRPGRMMSEDLYDRLTAMVFNEVELAAFAKAGMRRIADPGTDPLKGTPRLVNPREALQNMTDMHPGIGVTIVTRGSESALMRFEGSDKTIEIPVFPAKNPQRSTSLGDSFVAGFAAYLAASEGPQWRHRDGFESPVAQRTARNAAMFGSAIASMLTDTADRSITNTQAWHVARIVAAEQGYVLERPLDVSDGTNEQFMDVAARELFRDLQQGPYSEVQQALLDAPSQFSTIPELRAVQAEAFEAVIGHLHFGRDMHADDMVYLSERARVVAEATVAKVSNPDVRLVDDVMPVILRESGDNRRLAADDGPPVRFMPLDRSPEEFRRDQFLTGARRRWEPEVDPSARAPALEFSAIGF
jgi:hypothetical protein